MAHPCLYALFVAISTTGIELSALEDFEGHIKDHGALTCSSLHLEGMEERDGVLRVRYYCKTEYGAKRLWLSRSNAEPIDMQVESLDDRTGGNLRIAPRGVESIIIHVKLRGMIAKRDVGESPPISKWLQQDGSYSVLILDAPLSVLGTDVSEVIVTPEILESERPLELAGCLRAEQPHFYIEDCQSLDGT